MTQGTIVIANGAGAAVRAAINTSNEATVTKQSGSSAPSPTYPFMEWADTTNDLLKMRNAANSAWVIKSTLSAEYGGLPASGVLYSPGSPTLLNAVNVQDAIDETLALIQSNIAAPLIFSTGSDTVSALATAYIGPAGTSNTEALHTFVMPIACILDQMRAISGAVAGTGSSFTYTLMKGGINQTLTCGHSGTVGRTSSDLTNSVTFAAGDTVSVRLITDASVSATTHMISFRLRPII